MAAISSSTVTALLRQNPSGRTSSLSSSTSVFFSYKLNSRARVGLSVVQARGTNKRGFSCTCLFGLGVPELVVIVGVAALVFGPKQIPEVGRSIGKTVKGFQQAAKEFEVELRKDGEASAEAAASSSDKITADDGEKKQQEATKVPST